MSRDSLTGQVLVYDDLLWYTVKEAGLVIQLLRHLRQTDRQRAEVHIRRDRTSLIVVAPAVVLDPTAKVVAPLSYGCSIRWTQ